MSYCSVDDIRSDFKDIVFSATSSVTETEVSTIIQEESAFINSMISARYETPVSQVDSPNSFLVLKRICIFLVADRVRHILYVKTGRDASDQDTKGLRSLSRQPRKDLESIRDGKSKLTDATAVQTNIGFDVGTDQTCSDMIFDTTKQQW